MINFFKKFLAQLCMFFYLYSVQFAHVPFNLGTRVLLAVFGLFVLAFRIFKEVRLKKDISVRKDVIVYAGIFAIIIFFSLISIFLNRTRDFEFVKYPVSLCLILLATYFLHFIVKSTYRQVTYETIMNLIVIAVLVQVFLALISFLSPSIGSFLLSVQSVNELEVSKIEEVMTFRLIGFGSTFFGSGIINGFALMVIAVLIKNRKVHRSGIFFLSFSFLIILVLGMMMSRTTLIGFIFAIIYLLIPTLYFERKIVRNKWLFFVNLFLIPFFGTLLLTFLAPKAMENLSAATDFGFEMFVNYYETGKITTASTDALQESYNLPANAKTYIIGDGSYYIKPGDPSSGYAAGSDVGYLRLIYYFGILGTLSYFLLQYVVINQAIAINSTHKELKRFLLFGFLFCLLLNFKGFADIFFLITLFSFRFANESEATI